KNKIHTHEIIHIVIKGDTLWHIARRYINDPYRYPELARLSRIEDPDLIYPGNKVRIIVNRLNE
ncbi:MAG: LysM peptidoglycan-binding domain-containing protein, partial [Gammaproteobacteria bacterium]|nr:LysM peptidoglycan-binding domain-containing protein [Gammaproteobacteria bacterium]